MKLRLRQHYIHLTLKLVEYNNKKKTTNEHRNGRSLRKLNDFVR